MMYWIMSGNLFPLIGKATPNQLGRPASGHGVSEAEPVFENLRIGGSMIDDQTQLLEFSLSYKELIPDRSLCQEATIFVSALPAPESGCSGRVKPVQCTR